jgi:opacity protein-like surface antigen
MQTCPINLSSCPPGSILDTNPQRGQTAKVYAQVTNTGLQPGTNVRVTALFADASAGLPLLPASFWSTTFPAGSTTCGALDTSTGWHFAELANPCRVIPVVNPDVPEVVMFNWTVPMSQAEHSCMLIITESASDPLDPNIRSTNEVRTWELVPNNRQISLRNLHVIDTPPTPMGGTPRGIETMMVPNPSQSNFIELVFSSVDLPPSALLGVILPTRQDVYVQGAHVAEQKLSEAQRSRVLGINGNPDAFYRITDSREAVFRLPVPRGQTWMIAVVYDTGEMKDGMTARWSVLARQGNQIFGGNTYYIRPNVSGTGGGGGGTGGGTGGSGGTGSSGFFSIGLRAGVAIPQGTFNTFFDPGIAATADLEYHATNQFSVAGLFGYRRFSGPFSSHLNLYQFSAGPKFYLTSGSIRPFVNGGVGAFVFQSGTTKFGMHTGGGFQFRVWPKVWLEAEYQYHNVFTSGSNFQFSTVQGGARFRF